MAAIENAEETDVLIVGAGPAGATTAYYLAKANKKVTLLDRQTFPRDKVCGDFVGPAAIEELAEMGITELSEFKKTNIIHTAAVYADGQELICTQMPKFAGLTAQGRVIPRKKLDHWILNSAKKAGATLYEGMLVTGYRVEGGMVKVAAKDSKGTHTFAAKLLVGADGSNSLIASILHGYPTPKANRIVGARGYFENVEGPLDRADLHFATASFPGYFWLFPSGEKQANVGVGVYGAPQECD